MSSDAFFTSWEDVGRVLTVGVIGYVALVLLLRVSGKRTLSKLNAFDLVVTVALGSTLASILTSRSLSLAEGVAALALLILLQFAVTWTSVRWPWADRLVKSSPTLLLTRGQPIEAAMREQRVTEDELRSAVRNAGGSELEDASAIILKTDGSLTALLSGPGASAPGGARRRLPLTGKSRGVH